MKNVLLAFTIALLLLNGGASAQNIVTQKGDTSLGCYSSGSDITVYNAIKSSSATNKIVLKWTVVYSKFDAGWDVNGSGICDNNLCYYASMSNNLFTNGVINQSYAYDGGSFTGTDHDFHVIFGANNPAVGTSAVARINLTDTVSKTSRMITFIAQKCALGITTINSSDDIVLFPNPARDAVNVVYNEKAGVKTIAVYNMIGKLMGPIYKPSSSNSAKIDLDDMPTGIYFLRLMNSQGNVVATRRFTRQ